MGMKMIQQLRKNKTDTVQVITLSRCCAKKCLDKFYVPQRIHRRKSEVLLHAYLKNVFFSFSKTAEWIKCHGICKSGS